ncbi:MAG: class I SAM-dependent methyltransferase [Thaumarchaeota archaeon]|nr:class I SAM-dependent methyltransferase [Nitrososphaerota archaeon]
MKETIETPPAFGLKEDWNSIQRTLEEIIPVYDKTNRYISLGTDLRIRKAGIALLREVMGTDDFLLLDLGCGTGKMTDLFGAATRTTDRVLLVDPILGMMRIARSRTKAQGLLAVYENLPFRTGSIDAAMAGFSIRDARDLKRALSQLDDVLRPGGRFLIVDLSKPDSKVKSVFISAYWRLIAPVLAFAAAGRQGLKFAALSTTYRRLPKHSQLVELFQMCGFSVEKSESFMIGGASVIVIRKNV